MQILHITTHMGGGAGNAISNIILEDTKDSHRLICLQSSEKRQYVERCLQGGVEVWEAPGREVLEEQLKWSDVVVLHWWHHPLMCGMLADFPTDIPVRMILWAHISGCTYPILQGEFALQFDGIFFTTPFSFENEEWSADVRQLIKDRASVVYGIGQLDVEEFALKQHEPREELVIGYVGTLSNAKLHPQYVDYCEEVIKRLPGCHFLMVGDVKEAGWLVAQIQERGLDSYFEFTGYCTNVAEQLSRMDVFAYPLNPKHFGTTENVILEAMLAGLPVVLLNQNTEKYIVKDGQNGILVESKEEYAEAICKLYGNPDKCRTIGMAARAYVLEQYDVDRNIEVFREGVIKSMENSKRIWDFASICGREPHEWLLYGMTQKSRVLFQAALMSDSDGWDTLKKYLQNGEEILLGQSKSSIRHFAVAYPQNRQLALWEQLTEEK